MRRACAQNPVTEPRQSFLLRDEPELLEVIQEWAAEELRSTNAQIVYLLSEALAARSEGSLRGEIEGRLASTV